MKQKSWSARAFAFALAVVVVAAVSCRPPGGGDQKDGKDAKVEEAPINVRAERPEVRTMEEVIEVHGSLEPVEQVDVVTEVSGPIEDILVEVGDKVTKGQLLAKIDDDEYNLNLKQSQTALTVARSDYNSTKALFDEGMKSKQEMEKIKRTYDDARTNYELNELRFRNCAIKSPMNGVVVVRKAEMYHQAGAMEVLFTVADLSSYKVLITVTEAEVAKIRDGQQVRMRIDALTREPDDFPLSGTVSKIQPRVDPNTGTVQVEVGLAEPGAGARIGMFTRLKIITAVHSNVLVIPRKALISESGSFVWVAEGERARLVEIETGIMDAHGIEVLKGLFAEDLVITEGQAALTEKSKIKVVSSEAEPRPSPTPEPAPGATAP